MRPFYTFGWKYWCSNDNDNILITLSKFATFKRTKGFFICHINLMAKDPLTFFYNEKYIDSKLLHKLITQAKQEIPKALLAVARTGLYDKDFVEANLNINWYLHQPKGQDIVDYVIHNHTRNFITNELVQQKLDMAVKSDEGFARQINYILLQLLFAKMQCNIKIDQAHDKTKNIREYNYFPYEITFGRVAILKMALAK